MSLAATLLQMLRDDCDVIATQRQHGEDGDETQLTSTRENQRQLGVVRPLSDTFASL